MVCLRGVLRTATQAQDEVQGGRVADVVLGDHAVVLQLLAGKDEALLVWGNTCLGKGYWEGRGQEPVWQLHGVRCKVIAVQPCIGSNAACLQSMKAHT